MKQLLELATFDEDEIKQIIMDIYGIVVEKIERVNQGSANIFKIYSKDKEYILKEFQSKYKKEDVLKEINAISYLRENTDIPLPEYIMSKDFKYYFEHQNKVSILQKFIDGYTIKKNEGGHQQIIESAEFLGKIIEGFKEYECSDNVNVLEWISKEELLKANEKFDKILMQSKNTKVENKIKEDIIFKKKIINNIEQTINFDELSKVTHKISHGDYSCLQFIYNDNNKVKAILDFIKVKRLPIVWEIARSYTYIDKKTKNGEIDVNNLVEYVKAFMKYSKLNKYDLKYLPFVYLIQIARSPFGYEQYYKKVENKNELIEFAFYRTNICRSLNEKAIEISNRLEELEHD